MSLEIKKTILDIDTFLEKRPEFISYSEASIQSAINQSETLLDSECNGLISEVWSYCTQFIGENNIDNGFNQLDPNNPLYRTQWELKQIIEAHIAQVQYTLNLGNDWTIGSDSISMGGFNNSSSRPMERQVIAPSVYKLLQNARVYNLQFIGSLGGNKKEKEKCVYNPYDTEPITRNIGDKRYVQQYQPNVAKGNIAYVNESHIIDFGNPQDLNITTYNTNQILDPQTNEYVKLDKVKDLAFFGRNLYGYKSAVERGEMLNFLSIINMSWKEDFFYRKDTLISYAHQNTEGEWVLQNFLALRDNQGKDPLTSPEDWQSLGAVQTNIDTIVNLCYDRVVERYDSEFQAFKLEIQDIQNAFEGTITQQMSDFINEVNTNFANLENDINTQFENIKTNEIPNEIQKQLNELPTIENIVFHSNTIYDFITKENFETNIVPLYNLVENVDYETLPLGELIGTGENGEVVGQEYVTVNNILKAETAGHLHYTNISSAGGSGSVRGTETSSSMSNIRTSTDKDTFGVDEPTPFVPQYREHYFVKFLKDITQKGVVVYSENQYTWSNDFNVENNYVELSVDFLSRIDSLESQITTAQNDANNLKQNKLDKSVYEIDKQTFATNESVDTKDANTLQEAKDYTDTLFETFQPKPKEISLPKNGAAIQINSLNEIHTSGDYVSQSYTNNYSDLPKGVNGNGSGYMKVISFSSSGTGGVVNQYWYPRDAYNTYYVRTYNNNAWTNWAKFSGVVEN